MNCTIAETLAVCGICEMPLFPPLDGKHETTMGCIKALELKNAWYRAFLAEISHEVACPQSDPTECSCPGCRAAVALIYHPMVRI